MKKSAGLLLYRRQNDSIEVLLVHPGGPFWAKKDRGAWSVPKGLLEQNEAPYLAARREFEEEIGQKPPAGEELDLGEVRRSDGKVIRAWAMEGDLDVSKVKCNTFSMEWPPGSGKIQKFPENDRAEWFGLSLAEDKINAAQLAFLERLAGKVGIEYPAKTGRSGQSTLF